MSVICTTCNKELPEGSVVCPDCGTAFSSTTTAPISHTNPYMTAPVSTPETKVVGTGAFFWLRFLYGIPVIGWIACIIMCFAPKNKNIKNYARASLIWTILSIAMSVLCAYAVHWVFTLIMEYISTAFASLSSLLGGNLGELENLSEQINQLQELGILPEVTISY